jgi:hypothetical protein
MWTVRLWFQEICQLLKNKFLCGRNILRATSRALKTYQHRLTVTLPNTDTVNITHIFQSTNRKVAGSFPDGVSEIFHLHNPSGRTMVLGFTQTLTYMSTRNISWGWRQPVCTADNLTTLMCRLSWNQGISTSWNPQGLSRPVMGLLYLFTYLNDQDILYFFHCSSTVIFARSLLACSRHQYDDVLKQT